MRIFKTFTFEAAHRLPLVPEGHKCGRLHGHSYTVEIHVSGRVGADGFVIDFGLISDAWRPLHDLLDHRYLNELDGLENPTSEHLAAWIADRILLPELSMIVVKETCRTGCVFVVPTGGDRDEN